MKTLLRYCALYCLLALSTSPVKAHDVGILNGALSGSTANQRYSLSFNVSDFEANYLDAPILPKHCSLDQQTPSRWLNGILQFAITCRGRALTVADVIILPWEQSAVVLDMDIDGHQKQQLFVSQGQAITLAMSEVLQENSDWIHIAGAYLGMGFDHILAGIDHLLFVFGMMLLLRKPGKIIKAVTAFTIAHSITLGLAFFQVITLPSAPVEACIALSIAVLAYEIIRQERGQSGLTVRYPWLVCGAFGLLHGLGFAGALSESGVPQQAMLIALLFFNLGVELGQLLVIFALLLAARGIPELLNRSGNPIATAWRIPLASVLGGIATFWTLDRSISIVF